MTAWANLQRDWAQNTDEKNGFRYLTLGPLSCIQYPGCRHSSQKIEVMMLRLLNGSRISDKISTSSLLTKFNMLSVNQINAQMKLSEMWKAVNDEDHPFNIVKRESGPNIRAMRSITNEVLPTQNFSELSKQTFINAIVP